MCKAIPFGVVGVGSTSIAEQNTFVVLAEMVAMPCKSVATKPDAVSVNALVSRVPTTRVLRAGIGI